MANVQTKTNKKELEKEYRFRFFSVILVFLSVVGLLSTVIFIPSYFLADSRVETGKTRIEQVKQNQKVNKQDEYNQTLLRLEAEVYAFEEFDNNPDSSEIINSIIESRGGNIRIEGFLFTNENILDSASETRARNTNMLITGVAFSRDDLLSFAGRLRGIPIFSNVDLPIENLAQSSDVEFSMALSINSGSAEEL